MITRRIEAKINKFGTYLEVPWCVVEVESRRVSVPGLQSGLV